MTALARDPSRLPVHERLRPVASGVHDSEAVKEVVTGADAVLSAVGQSLLARSAVCTDAMHSILPAMEAHGVRRLVAVSLYGVGESRRNLLANLTRVATRSLVRDKEGMEALIAASDTDWTILRPAVLGEGPHTGRYRTGSDLRLTFTSKMAFADLADAMLGEVTGNGSIRRAIAITA